MKHLNVYESKKNSVWLVIQISTSGPDDYEIEIFDDKESAENYYVDLVNELFKQEIGPSNKDHVFTVEDANKIKDELTYRIVYYEYKSNGKYELPENLKFGRDLNKYNL